LTGTAAGLLLGACLVTSVTGGAHAARRLTSTPDPQLTLDRLIETSPFTSSATRVFDNEGSAFVPADDALWMADDQGDALLEVDRTTGQLRRRIPQSVFVNAPRVGTGASAGPLRNEDLEALAYDADADVLYAFSGSTPSAAGASEPTAYRLARGADDQLHVASWRALTMESAAAGWRMADGQTYVGNRSTIRTYDYTTNTFGAPISIPGLARILGLDFDDVTGDLLAVTNRERLFRASMTTHTLLDGWNGIDLTSLGLLDTRAVEVIGEQVLVTDGFDTRPNSDPRQHAVFVLDVTTDTTDPVVSIAVPADGKAYPRNRVVNADFACADTPGGTGVASCEGTVADGQAIETASLGPQTFTVTATDNAGNTTEVTHDYTVANGRPDGRIRRGNGAVVGNNTYNTSGVGQTRTGSALRGRSVTYYVSVQNDAPFAERLRVRGQAATARFAVQYRDPANVKITSQVVAGTYRTPILAPGAVHRIRAIVTVRLSAPRNASLARTVTSISDTHPTIKDTVRFVTNRA
jgi:Esterase-like activity of phytase